MPKIKVAIAMSGGVDSSVAAVLLKEQGFDIFGMTMSFAPRIKCGNKGIEDAHAVAKHIGIEHYVVNVSRQFKKKVIDDFCLEYGRGSTPNPCVRCNQFIKFGELLKKALALNADFLATGHYARIERTDKGLFLRKAKDAKKDQSYFLYRLNENQLKHARFPLGDYTKEAVRQIARDHHLPVAEKTDSQEICFIPDNDYRGFLQKQMSDIVLPGEFVDTKGNIVGAHKGVAFYTIGQREGLGIALGYPVYVVEIKYKENRIILGTKEEALGKEFFIAKPHFALKNAKKKVAVMVRIRYNHKEVPAEIFLSEKRYKIILQNPQFAVTPGQSAVFYDHELVLGGGIIEKVVT